MGKLREKISLSILAAFYVLFNFKYMPGHLAKALVATLEHLLTTAPIIIGLTILVVSFLQRMHGEKMAWDRRIRIFLTFGIIAGFLIALNDYWLRGAQAL